MNHDDKKTLALMEKYPKTKQPKRSSKTTSSAPKRVSRARKNPTPTPSKIRLFFIKFTLILSIGALLILGSVTLYNQTINYNPLLGTWRAKTVMGIMEISFTRNSVSNFGAQRAVSYDVKKNEVIVIYDDIKMGESYRIVDDATISIQSGASNITFKRVTKSYF